MALPYAAGKIPVSATPPGIIKAGEGWGLTIVKNDKVTLTKFGDEMLSMICAHKDAIVEEQEGKARARAGDAGGQYLDEIGVFDLTKLNEDQWSTFVKKITDTYMYWRLSSK